jgi:formamidopyrimidine-DNA glycosylase
VVGRTIKKVVSLRPDIVTPAGADLSALLRRRRINAIHRRGKRIIFTLDSSERFYVHLGMTGQLTVTRRDEPIPPHTHMRLDLGDKLELRFRDPRRFGGVWWIGRDDLGDAGMGPEPLKMRPSQLFQRLHKTSRAVKNALMDQTVVAGLGNIYVDESLFAAGIHPLQPGDTLTVEQVSKLNRAIKTTLKRALRHRGSTLRDYMDAEGGAGAFQNFHSVYDRAGKPCGRCRKSIERIVLGGRSTHFCPACQGRLRQG